ncbi:MAG: mannose-1-phosphate guanylyltransferase/mannose-6-phosphate isomerase [Meiothermus sp.]
MIAVILSGGAGTRLWPVSRELYPKPFMRLPDGQSLLQKALLRAVGLPGVSEVLTVTGQEHYYSTLNEYQALEVGDHPPLTFVIEPSRRNTAAAIAMAALSVAERHGADQILLILSADHLIEEHQAFVGAVQQARAVAQQGYLVTFGIKPTYPATGFGYLEPGEPLTEGAYAVRRFVEKPDAERAKAYLEGGGFLWNAGIFCFSAGAYLEALQTYAPQVYEAAVQCWQASPREVPQYLDTKTFSAVPNISVDYAVMERAERVAVVPCCFSWSDLGSWDAAALLVPADPEGNRVLGEAVLVDTRGTFVQTEERLVAAIGVEDLVIVDTRDALLVTRRDRVQDVKKVVERLQKVEHEAIREHRTVQRRWGSYTVLEEGPRFKIKRLVIRPGQALSFHLHHHRSEHWTVVSGTAQVLKQDQVYLLRTNEALSVLAGTPHRLSNPGLIDLVIIEVQSGEYLGEDDLVRLDLSEPIRESGDEAAPTARLELRRSS